MHKHVDRTGDSPLHKLGKLSNLLPEGPIASCESASLAGSQRAQVHTQEILRLPSTISPTCKLSSKARLPYDCITGYATTKSTLINTNGSKKKYGRDWEEMSSSQLDQIFFCNPVVIESICYRTRAKRRINEGNTTGGLRKIWTGSKRWRNCLRQDAIFFLKALLGISLAFIPNVLVVMHRLPFLSIRKCRSQSACYCCFGIFPKFSSSCPNYFQPSNCIAVVYQLVCSHTIADQLY